MISSPDIVLAFSKRWIKRGYIVVLIIMKDWRRGGVILMFARNKEDDKYKNDISHSVKVRI